MPFVFSDPKTNLVRQLKKVKIKGQQKKQMRATCKIKRKTFHSLAGRGTLTGIGFNAGANANLVQRKTFQSSPTTNIELRISS